MAEPLRIQRKRAKGWRMPEGAVAVDRSTALGNPFVIGKDGSAEQCVHLYKMLLAGNICLTSRATFEAQERARRAVVEALPLLRGRPLACWCRIGQSCHADVLLQLANAPVCDDPEAGGPSNG